jgi:hypothetical protein
MSQEEQIANAQALIESAQEELYKATKEDNAEKIVTYSYLVGEYEQMRDELIAHFNRVKNK